MRNEEAALVAAVAAGVVVGVGCWWIARIWFEALAGNVGPAVWTACWLFGIGVAGWGAGRIWR